MKFISPSLSSNEKVCAVYKITLNNHWFYYGSSTNLKSRICQWRLSLLYRKDDLPSTFIKIIDIVEIAEIDIVEICGTEAEARNTERHLIKLFVDNPLLLNRSGTGKQPIKCNERIIQMNDLYQTLAIHQDLQTASKTLGIPEATILLEVTGKPFSNRRPLRGYRFAKEV